MLQAVNHGLVVAPLFFVVALLAERAEGSEDIRDYGGIAFRAPILAVLFLIVALATLAMPGSANFAGEFLILLGTFSSVQSIAFVASIGVILASVYALRMYIRSMHNRVGPQVASFDLSFRDSLVLVPLVLVIIAFALYPQLALDAGEAGDQVDRAGGGSMKGPVINWEALSPAIALTAAGCIVLLGRARAVGLHPPQRRPGTGDHRAGRHRRARDLAVGRQRGDHRQRAGRRQSLLGAAAGVLQRRHRGRAALVAVGRGDRGG